MALWSAIDDLPLTPWTFSSVVNEARGDIALISACLWFFREVERVLVLDRVLRHKIAVLPFLTTNFVIGMVFWYQPP
eukprot:IDg5216t1